MTREEWEIIEKPNLKNKKEIALLQKLLNRGTIWSYRIGREVPDLVEAGYLQYPTRHTYGYWGEHIPTRAEYDRMHKKDKRLKA